MSDDRVEIDQIRDPGLFQRLVRAIHIAEYGLDYQVVDDSGGDNGLDGYHRTKKTLHAIYCPEKPESARYRRKYTSDIEKAVELTDKHGYAITTFVFVTPHVLREPDQRDLREKARGQGFEDGLNVASEYLAVLLRRHGELVDMFPTLAYPTVEAKLDEIRELLLRKTEPARQVANERSEERSEIGTPEVSIWLFAGTYDREVAKCQERLNSGDTGALARLTTIRATHSDPRIRLLALSIIVDYQFGADRLADSEAAAREAISIAKSIESEAHEAHFRAMISRAVAQQAAEIDLMMVQKIRITNLTGIPVVSAQDRKDTVEQMRMLHVEADGQMEQALKLSERAKNLETSWQVFYQFAWKEATLAYPHVTQGNTEHVEKAMRAVHSSFQRMLSIAPHMGQEMVVRTEVAYASTLQFLGDSETALSYAKEAMALAEANSLDELHAQAAEIAARMDQ